MGIFSRRVSEGKECLIKGYKSLFVVLGLLLFSNLFGLRYRSDYSFFIWIRGFGEEVFCFVDFIRCL